MCCAVQIDGSVDRQQTGNKFVCVRYIDFGGCIQSAFLGVIEPESNGAKGLLEAVLKATDRVGIDYKKIVGITTDGESANTGKQGGLWKLLQDHWNKSLITVWCTCHRSDLAMEDMEYGSRIESVEIYCCTGDLFSYIKMQSKGTGCSWRRERLKQQELVHECCDVWEKISHIPVLNDTIDDGTKMSYRLRHVHKLCWCPSISSWVIPGCVASQYGNWTCCEPPQQAEVNSACVTVQWNSQWQTDYHRLRGSGSANTVLTATGQVNVEIANFDPSQNRNPWADCNKITHLLITSARGPPKPNLVQIHPLAASGPMGEVNVFVPYLCIYLCILFFWDSRTGQTGWWIFTRDSSLDVKSRKDVLFRGYKT